MNYIEGSWHIDIIRDVILSRDAPRCYIEIGIRSATCFNDILHFVQEAHGVDIDEKSGHLMEGGTFYNMSSDEFWELYEGPLADVIFIDGDHSYAQVKIDYHNALKFIDPNGTIVLHDSWPVVRENAVPGVCDGVWQLAAELELAPLVNAYTYRNFPGVTLIQHHNERFTS